MKKLTVKDYKNRLDKLVSIAVRYNDDPRCYTCGKRVDPNAAHCSHFIGRSCRVLRYEPDNVRKSCAYCNTYLNGNLARYYRHLKSDSIDADRLLFIEDEWKKGKIKPLRYLDYKTYYDYWLPKARMAEKWAIHFGIIDKEKIPKSW